MVTGTNPEAIDDVSKRICFFVKCYQMVCALALFLGENERANSSLVAENRGYSAEVQKKISRV